MNTDLHDLMDRALADVDAPTDRLREGSMARGRGVRRRRRAAAVLGVAVAAVMVTSVALPSLGGTDDDTGDHVAHEGGAPTPDTRVGATDWWNMPGAVMRDRLAGLLPEGFTISDANLGDEDLAPGEEPTGGWVAVDVLDAGAPAGGINVVLYPPTHGGSFAEDGNTCPDESTEAETCAEAQAADRPAPGRVVRSSFGDVVTISVRRRLPDGGIVYAAMSNSSDDKWGQGSSTDREAPPLRAAQLVRIAGDPSWQDWAPQD